MKNSLLVISLVGIILALINIIIFQTDFISKLKHRMSSDNNKTESKIKSTNDAEEIILN